MARFESIFNKYVKDKDYKYNPKQSINDNALRLQRMACLENSCRTLYEKTDGIYGESYAERILESVLQNKLSITAFEYYPLPEVHYCENRIYMNKYLNVAPKPMKSTVASLTLITFYTSLMQEIIATAKKGGHIELFDFFICLSMYIEKWKITEYPKYVARNIYSDEFLAQIVKHVIYCLFTKPNEINTITLSILDRSLFEKIARPSEYQLVVNIEGDIIKPNYDSYVQTIELFLKFIKTTQNSEHLVQPNVRVYAVASNKLRPEILELISHETGINISVVHDVFKHIHFDALPQDLSSVEYRECWDKLEEIKTSKKVDWYKVRAGIKAIFEKDYIQYLNYRDKKLAYLFHRYDVDKLISSFEVIYVKIQDATIEPYHNHYTSEVQIEFADLVEGTNSQEEYKDRLIHAYLDAQAINQVRNTIVDCKKDNRYHVKINNVDSELISYTYSVLDEQNTWLRNTYNLHFTFDICQRMFFRDKGRKCYLLL